LTILLALLLCAACLAEAPEETAAPSVEPSAETSAEPEATPQPAKAYVLVQTATQMGFLPVPDEGEYAYHLEQVLPDGTPAVTLSGNTLTAILAPQALTCAGEVGVSVVLWDDRQDQLATFPFRVLVEANPAAGAQVSDNYYKLQNLEQVNAAYDALLTHVEFLTQQVEAGIGVTDEQIAAVVESYLNENPPEAVTDGQLAQAVERYMAENPASGTIHVTGAAPGQTPVVKTVDGSGVPTAWEMAAFPTDTHIRSLIDTALGVIENGTY
jgi:hypothetical protein